MQGREKWNKIEEKKNKPMPILYFKKIKIK